MYTQDYYSKETFNRRLKKYGIGYFLAQSITEEELSIVNTILNGESLEDYYRNMISV